MDKEELRLAAKLLTELSIGYEVGAINDHHLNVLLRGMGVALLKETDAEINETKKEIIIKVKK